MIKNYRHYYLEKYERYNKESEASVSYKNIALEYNILRQDRRFASVDLESILSPLIKISLLKITQFIKNKMNSNKKHHFFACVSRMRFIKRWGLMRNNQEENVQEHSLQVAIIAHALATIRNTFYKGQLNTDRIVTLAIFHDAAEVITSDLPRPVKYFDPQVRKDYSEIEKFATERLTHMLPKKLQKKYEPLLDKDKEDQELLQVIKNADIISSYLKCIEEVRMGNDEFKRVASSIKKKLYSIKAPEVLYFIKQFIPSFFVTIDEWN